MFFSDFKTLGIRTFFDCLINMKFSNNVKDSTQNQKLTSNIVNKFKSNSEQKTNKGAILSFSANKQKD